MKKVFGLIILAVMASAGCASDAKSEKGSITPTTASSTSTTSTTVKAVVATAACVEFEASLTAVWEKINKSMQDASDAGVTAETKAALEGTGRSAIKTTRTWIAMCGDEFPPAKTAQYEGWIEKIKLVIGN